MRTRGPVLKCAKFSKTGTGKWQRCPGCQKALTRMTKPTEGIDVQDVTPTEVLNPPEPPVLNAEAVQTTDGTITYWTLKDLAGELGRSYNWVWTVMNEHPELGYVPSKGMPDKNLSALEEISKARPIKKMPTPRPPQKPSPYAQKIPAPAPAEPTPNLYRLPNEYAIVASFLGMNEAEFIDYCVKIAEPEIRRRLRT